MEVAPHQDGRCDGCRLDALEDQLMTVSSVLGWILLALSGYLLYKSGILRLELFHG